MEEQSSSTGENDQDGPLEVLVENAASEMIIKDEAVSPDESSHENKQSGKEAALSEPVKRKVGRPKKVKRGAPVRKPRPPPPPPKQPWEKKPRYRKVYSPVQKPEVVPEIGRGSNRGSGRDGFPFDDEVNHFYPCPICLYKSKARLERNFHMREAHPGYTYQPGDELQRFAIDSGKDNRGGSRKSKDASAPSQPASEVSTEEPEAASDDQEIAEQPASSLSQAPNPNQPEQVVVVPKAEPTSHLVRATGRRPKPIYRIPTQAENYRLQMSMNNKSVPPQGPVDIKPLKEESWHNPISQNILAHSGQLNAAVKAEVIAANEVIDDEIYVEDVSKEDRRLENDHSYTNHVQYSEGKAVNSECKSPEQVKKKRKTRPRKNQNTDPNNIPDKVRISDPNGQYKCYVQGCEFRASYRGLRSEHMRLVHPDWEQPSRYLLQRISVDGVYVDPEKHVPIYACHYPGCDWRGNFRATRSSHMRTVHRDYHEQRKKAPTGGFLQDGAYYCHVEGCHWRGSSRSTRASHIKKEHPGFKSTAGATKKSMLTECFQCFEAMSSQTSYIHHIQDQHGLSFLVNKKFTSSVAFDDWLNNVQSFFSIEFVRRRNLGVTDLERIKMHHLYCSVGDGSSVNGVNKLNPVNSYRSKYLIRKNLIRRAVFRKCGRNCATYLQVIEDKLSGECEVEGVLEHTGHRMGTPLLRFDGLDREAMYRIFFAPNDGCGKCVISDMQSVLDEIRKVEGYSMDGFDVSQPDFATLEAYALHDDPLISLYKLALMSANSTNDFFGESLVREMTAEEEMQKRRELADRPGTSKDDDKDEFEFVMPAVNDISLGIMTAEMKKLYIENGVDGIVCIEEAQALISDFDLSIFYVLVIESATGYPRCVCVYITDCTDRMSLLKQLQAVDPRPPAIFMTDESVLWPATVSHVYGELADNVQMMISEWNIMSYWAREVDHHVDQKYDKVAIVCALRRFLRYDHVKEAQFFDHFIVELFEAFTEMRCDGLAKVIDTCLFVDTFCKRWSPMERKDILTKHSCPKLEITARTFRESYLDPYNIERLDMYVGLIINRIDEFNRTEPSEPFSLRPPDKGRSFDSPQYFEEGVEGLQTFFLADEDVQVEEIYADDELKHGYDAQYQTEGEWVVEEDYIEEDGQVKLHQDVQIQPGQRRVVVDQSGTFHEEVIIEHDGEVHEEFHVVRHPEHGQFEAGPSRVRIAAPRAQFNNVPRVYTNIRNMEDIATSDRLRAEYLTRRAQAHERQRRVQLQKDQRRHTYSVHNQQTERERGIIIDHGEHSSGVQPRIEEKIGVRLGNQLPVRRKRDFPRPMVITSESHPTFMGYGDTLFENNSRKRKNLDLETPKKGSPNKPALFRVQVSPRSQIPVKHVRVDEPKSYRYLPVEYENQRKVDSRQIGEEKVKIHDESFESGEIDIDDVDVVNMEDMGVEGEIVIGEDIPMEDVYIPQVGDELIEDIEGEWVEEVVIDGQVDEHVEDERVEDGIVDEHGH